MFRSTTIIRELQCPCQSHYYLSHSCMYAKRGGVAAYHIVWIGLCCGRLESPTALARTRTPGTHLKHKLIQTI